MAFGYAGAHRTGKTTLAKRVAEDLGMHFHDASVSKIMREAGIDAVGDVPMEQRIEAQEFLLRRFLQDLNKAPRPLISDRTPLDMIGYCLGEVTMHNTTPELGKRIDAYVKSCLEATKNYFDTIVILGPLPHYDVAPDKPPPNAAYQRLVQFLVEGAACQVNPAIYCEWLYNSDFEERRDISNQIFCERITHIAQQSKLVRKH